MIKPASMAKTNKERNRNETLWCKALGCCMWPYRSGSGRDVYFQFRFEMQNFNLTTSLSCGRESTNTRFIWCPCILHKCVQRCPEKCAPKILIKFIYINAVQHFRIAVWYADGVGRGSSTEGKRKKNNTIFPIAWKNKHHWIRIHRIVVRNDSNSN